MTFLDFCVLCNLGIAYWCARTRNWPGYWINIGIAALNLYLIWKYK